MKNNVLKMQKLIRDDVDEKAYSSHYNMIICMITSTALFLGAVVSFVVRHFILHDVLLDVIVDSAVLTALGAGFEIFMRTRIKDLPKATHIISLLYTAVFVIIVLRFYNLIGPSVWMLGMLQVLFSMGQSSPIMLRYTVTSLGLSIIYFVIFSVGYRYELLYDVMLIAFFILAAIVASIVYKVMNIRNRKIVTQFERLQREIEQKKEVQRENMKLSFYDRLTGLPNRALCIERLAQTLYFAKGSEGKVCVLFLDLDMFKMINDTMGQHAGDELLKGAALRLKAIFDYGFVARIGGDKFVIILQSDKGDIKSAADLILNTMKDPFFINSHKFSVTCSIGISRFPSDGSNGEELVKCAELAMQKAKEEGKNRYKFYTPDLKQSMQSRMDLIRDMHSALSNNEFTLFYQPQINSGNKTIIGMEALLRWKHPVRGMVMPGEFIPVAEESGLIVPIGHWAIKCACVQNKSWQDQGFAKVPVAVNISSKEIFDDSIVGRLSKILDETQLDPRFLELEITERILIKDIEKVKQILHNIKQLGVRISIDDFGTGYSSIYYLQQLPIDVIKIPMEFVHGIGRNIKDEAIISVILELAGNLNMEAIAEGVETKAQLDFLTKGMCTSIQGFYFCKPMEAKKILPYCEKKLKKPVNTASVAQNTGTLEMPGKDCAAHTTASI